MKRAVNNFTQRLKTNKGIGLFYFSGHDLQDNNSHNYLIPVNARSNLSVLDILTYVTNKVSGETANRQIPWQSGSMKDIFCFSRCSVSKELAQLDAKNSKVL